MSHVEDPDILTRLRLADPADLAELERTVAPLRARVKQRAIEQGSLPSKPIPAGDRVALEAGARRGRSRRRWPALGFASFACAAVLAVVIILSGGSVDPVGDGTYPGFAEAAVKVAEANPRLLITAPGWKIVEARSFKATNGQLFLADDDKRVHLFWLPASYYKEFLRTDSRPRDGRQVGTTTIAGREATTVHDEHTPFGGYFQAIFPPEGGIFVQLEGAFEEPEWDRLMASVRSVGVEDWLTAMPGEILRPRAISAELTEMLRGVSAPPGFDPTTAVYPTQLTNRFQAAKRLTQALTCGWVERWSTARRSGDTAAAEEAVDAMADAAKWPVLLQMVREKGYRGHTLPAPGYLWPTSIIMIAHQMAAGHLERERAGVGRGTRVVAEGFQMPQGAYPPAAVRCFPPPPGSP